MSNFVKKIKNLLIYTTMLPFYWLSCVIPKDKNLWIFGAWFGERYADNSKYLFEYVNKNCPEIKAIWLTRDQNTYKLIKNRGYRVYKSYSLKGIYYSLRAKVGIVSTSLRDINMYLTGNMQIVQLWHGIPLKKIMFDDRITFKHPNYLKKLLFLIFPFLKKNLYYSDALLIATSEEVRKKISSAFKVSLDNVKVTGYPRNDSIFQTNEEVHGFFKDLLQLKRQGKKIALYMPTHRREGELNLTKLFLSNLDSIDKRMKDLNCFLLIKLHFYHSKEISFLLRNRNLSNVLIVTDDLIEQDIYSILSLVDVLITDYSSIFFDYLLLDRPIIFSPFDIEDYLKKDREFYYDYNEVTPGPKARNWDEVLMYLEEAIENPRKYEKKRREVRRIFHKFCDGKNSNRVFREIMKCLEKES